MEQPKSTILSIVYLEPEWELTKRCIEATGLPVVYVDRDPKGVGSLAQAINAGVNLIATKYVWIVTNVFFNKETAAKLEQSMEGSLYAAMTPTFDSDHRHTQRIEGYSGLREAPFIEFTAAMVRTDIMQLYPLDEDMPYWGHDLDFGRRLTEFGFRIGVDHGAVVEHVYIRNKRYKNMVTEVRKAKRRESDVATRDALIKKWGKDWRVKLGMG